MSRLPNLLHLHDAPPPSGKPVRDELNSSKALSDGLEKRLQDAIANFKAGWKAK